jgi:raffinose/stachyose/melibiose transport system substrate-binding protein
MKRLLSGICSILITLSIFSGCSGNGAKSSQSGSSAKTTITLMQSKTEIQSDMQKVVDGYNASQQNTTVKLLGTSGDNYTTVLQSQFSAKPEKAPTIFTASGLRASSFEPYMASLDDTKSAKLIMKSFQNEVTVNGKISGIPMAVEGYGLIYNKDLFKKAGVDASSIKSVDGLVDACKKLQKVNGVTHAIAMAKENYFAFIHPFNWGLAVSNDYSNQIKQLERGKISFSNIPTVSQFMKDLDKILPYTNQALDSYDDQISGFAGGKYAMIHQGDWAQSMLDQDKISFDYGMIAFPTGGNTKLSVDISDAWRVNKYATADQQKAAKDFLDWLLTSDKGQTYCADTFQFISSLKGMKSSSSKLGEIVSNAVQSSNTVPWVFNTSSFPNGIDVDGASLMQKYYAKVINSDEFMDQLTQTWRNDATK